jgi:hypothetical protein
MLPPPAEEVIICASFAPPGPQTDGHGADEIRAKDEQVDPPERHRTDITEHGIPNL